MRAIAGALCLDDVMRLRPSIRVREIAKREPPSVLDSPGMIVLEMDDRAVRLDQPVEDLERGGAIHPVEGAAHGDQPEWPNTRRHVEGAAPTNVERHSRILRRLA